jgi:hypothetical protein
MSEINGQGNCVQVDAEALIALLARPDLSRTDVQVYLGLAILTVGKGHAWTAACIMNNFAGRPSRNSTHP